MLPRREAEMDRIDQEIQRLWSTSSTAEIVQATGLAERSIRWRARRMGLARRRRGRKRQAARTVAEMPKAAAALPISDPVPQAPRATLPKDFEAYRPGCAPQPVARKDP